MRLTIEKSSKQFEVDVHEEATVADLKKAIQKMRKLHPTRQGLKQEKIRLDDPTRRVADYNLDMESVITLKDLGPQVGYRTVFLVEYFGPILFFVLYGMRPSFIYGEASFDILWST